MYATENKNFENRPIVDKLMTKKNRAGVLL